MQHNNTLKVTPIEKIISILSYFTMGTIGFVWLLLAYFLKKKLRYFLMYNIAQSMLIAILLAFFNFLIGIILSIIARIPFIDIIAAIINWIISLKIINILFFSFSIFELCIFSVLIYITVGIIKGKIFNIPIMTKLISNTMKNYK